MGSRLRPVPDRVLECLIEVSAPTGDEGSKLLSYYPETYDDVAWLQDVVSDFCFPFAKHTEMVDAVQHFTFVLTSIDSLYRFGFCRYPPKAKTCLCIISDLPAFEMFYGMLNTFAELENAHDKVLSAQQFIDLIMESQVPEPGCKFTISVPEKDWRRQYNYPDPARLPSIPESRNLTDYFSAVNPSNMIVLFASLMFERRIIITSKRLSLLTACTYSASTLLYPMYWQHVFIPAIPPSLIEYCCAPMPFLIGVHSSLMSKVRDMPLDDVVILDVDRNEIELPFDDLEGVPSEALHKLESALKKSTIAIGDYVSQQFLDAIVVLIGDYRDALKLSSDTIVFDREKYVNSRPHMKSFLENLLTLQLFEQFIQHRLEQLNSGQGIDDVFEEQVGLHAGNNSKWASQYKQWVKSCKRDGRELLKDISGKTEKARYKANKFIQASFVHMKNQSKSGWKGIKEKKKNFFEYVKGTEIDLDDDDIKPGGLQKCNSLPMRKKNGVNISPLASRKSIGSSLHDRILFDSPPVDPKNSPCPSRPPPRNPPRPAPPRPPSPYKPTRPSSDLDNDTQKKPRPSMARDPNEPPVKDLIVFYDSQEDLTNPAGRNPFKDFNEYDYKSGSGKQTNSTNGEEKNSSGPNETEDLLWETFVSLSDGTREFLRQSRIENSQLSEMSLPGKADIEAKTQPPKPVKKTLKELALDRQLQTKVGLTHSGSCPSLFDPLDDVNNTQKSIRGSRSSTNLAKTFVNDVRTDENIHGEVDSTHAHHNDPFFELISQRHKLKPTTSVANGNPKWVTDFE